MANADAGADATQGETPADTADVPEKVVPSVPDTSFGGRLLLAPPANMTESLDDEARHDIAEIAEQVRGAYWTGCSAVASRSAPPRFSWRV